MSDARYGVLDIDFRQINTVVVCVPCELLNESQLQPRYREIGTVRENELLDLAFVLQEKCEFFPRLWRTLAYKL